MNIGVLGTGVVGETLATALTKKGYNVRMESHTTNNEKAAACAKGTNNHATQGDFNDAKNEAAHFLVNNFHWKAMNLLDLGGIENARVTEGVLPFWVSVLQTLGTPMFNFKIVK